MSDEKGLTQTAKATELLKAGKTVAEIAKELNIKHPGFLYTLRKKVSGAAKAKPTAKKIAVKAKRNKTSSVIVEDTSKSRVGHYYVNPDFPLAFASETLGRKYVGEKAQLTKVAVLLS